VLLDFPIESRISRVAMSDKLTDRLALVVKLKLVAWAKVAKKKLSALRLDYADCPPVTVIER
jgi:hypothetical protein